MDDALNLDTKRDKNHWRKAQPRSWQTHDVLDFVFHHAAETIEDMTSFGGEYFRFDGQTLCNKSREELKQIGGGFGEVIYTEVQKLISSWDSSVQENSTWKCKRPEKWNPREVLDWLFYAAALCDKDFDLTTFPGEKFHLSGKVLCRLSCEEFVKRDVNYGQQLHGMLKHLLSQSTFEPPDSTFDIEEDIKPCDYLSSHEATFYDNKFESDFKTIDRRLFLHGNDPSLALTYPHQNLASPLETLSLTPQIPLTEKRPYPEFLSSNYVQLQSLQPSSTFQQVPAVKRFKPDQTSSVPLQPVPEMVPDSSTKNKAGSKTRLWKFMWDLLQNPMYNPEYIRWESKKDGIFRIVSGRSKAIAELWGKIKNNPRMTFDKLGRSLRWCRANNGLFSAIPKNGVYPKKLCFRFMTNQLQELERTA